MGQHTAPRRTASTPPPAATRQARRGAVGPFGPVIDAAHMAASRFADPVMMEGVGALDQAAEVVEAIAAAFDQVGQAAADQIAFDPRVLPYFVELGTFLRTAVGPTRDAAAAVRAVHAEDIRRIEENDPRERRKDVSAHDGR